MLILGIGDHVSCGSALVSDGVVISAINDERLVREKMVFGVPRESIRANLEICGLSPRDVDAIAVGTQRQHLIEHYVDFREGWFGLKRSRYKQYLFDLASHVSRYRRWVPFLDTLYYAAREPAFRRRRAGLRRILREEFGFTCPVYFLDHHFCHVASAYYTSGFDRATVVSIDGGGDGKSCRIYDAVNGQFRELVSIPSFDSLGAFYSYITQLCGFKAGRHEGKITGLAAYGVPRYVPQLERIIVQQNGFVKNRANVFFLSALKELERLLPEDFVHRDLAASVQVYTEKMVVDLVSHYLRKTGHSKVALAGGLFANVKVNQRVHEIPGVEAVFVHPGMSDEGIPVGAALAAYYQLSKVPYDPSVVAMKHVYLGPEFGDAEIARALECAGIAAQRYEDVETEIARLLAEGAVVARFHGRMEYGPRALGNRSILYQATDASVNYWMNDALKRTEFMPFAPIVLREHAARLFKHLEGAEDTARFMTITFDCTEWMARHCPGVVHVDNTARPQLVSEEDNPSAYRILKRYHELTGLPCLINTSFNMHEEPIVCTPEDAIRAFKLGHLDYLAIGNWIARNPEPVRRIVDKGRIEVYLNRCGSHWR